jgi:hypothetical protein
MAKGIYEQWLENENLLLLRGWKTKGLTDQQIADNIGINVRTLDKWKASHGQIRQALKRGKEHANYAVENALLKKAMDGNTTAMIFWLKNNYRDKYTDDVTDPSLRKAQIRKANAEADIAEAKAKRENNGDGTDAVNVNIIMPNSSEEQNDNE